MIFFSSVKIITKYKSKFFFFLWRCDPTRVMAISFLRFLDHTQRRATVCKTPLDERSARCRDFYLTTHDTHNRQVSMSPGGIRSHDLTRRPQNYTLDGAATRTGTNLSLPFVKSAISEPSIRSTHVTVLVIELLLSHPTYTALKKTKRLKAAVICCSLYQNCAYTPQFPRTCHISILFYFLSP
jgi:hypothetical protein